MVTIKDIAREAGVSHGTASNVLNKRGNVRADKIKLVEDAAQKLGYTINSQAQVLRKGLSNKCFVLILSPAKERYSDFMTELLDMETPHEFEFIYIKRRRDILPIFQEKVAQLPRAILCLGFSVQSMNYLCHSSTKVLEIDTYLGEATICFDRKETIKQFDYFLSVSTIEKLLFLELDLKQNVSLLSAIYDRFGETLQSEFIKMKDIHQLLSIYPFLKQYTHNDCIVVSDKEMLHSLKELYNWFGITNTPQFYLIGASDWIKHQDTHYLTLDYRRLARECVSYLECEMAKIVPIEPVVLDTLSRKERSRTSSTLRLLIIESPMSHALKIVADRYAFLTGIHLEIIEKNYEEILEMMSNPSSLKDIDMIRMDMAWLPTYAESIFVDLTKYVKTEQIYKKLTPAIPNEYTHCYQKKVAFPLDISSQILIYRKDIFENTLIQRQYFEKYKVNLETPKTYKDFDRVATFFTQKCNPDSPTEYGHSLALKSPLVAACDFIPRFRESLLLNQMDLKIITEVVAEYKANSGVTRPTRSDWWESFVTSLERGETVMEILFSNYASPLFNENMDTNYQFEYATIPGNQPVIGGGSLGISRSSKKIEECLDFIDWLFSKEISVFLAYLGGFLPTKYVVQDIKLRNLFPWLDNFEETFTVGSRTKWHHFETDLVYEQLLGQELIELFSNM